MLNSRCLNFKLSTNGFSLGIGGECVGRQRADLLSTLFDIGGIAGWLLLSSVLYELILHKYYIFIVVHVAAGTVDYCYVLYLYTGSISTGFISDLLDARAISCVLMMYLAVPTVSVGLIQVCM